MHDGRVPTDTNRGLVSRFRLNEIGGALLFALAVGLGAHLALDRIANLVLDHDPFDDLRHPTRVPLGVCIAAFVALGTLRALWSALVEASQRRGRIARTERRERPFLLDACGAFAGGCVALPALEALDALIAARPVADLGELFAGSFGLALAVTAIAALIATASLRAVLRFLVGFRTTLVVALAVLLCVARDAKRRVESWRSQTHACDSGSEPLWIRAGKRGPPTLRRA